MRKQKLHLDQLTNKMKAFAQAKKVVIPPTGWIKTVRMSLGISLQQVANKLSVTRQSVREMEQREREGAISLKSLREAAHALDMELIYGFVPKDGTLEALIERRARDLATKIVSRTSHTMKLEDQENSGERLQKAIAERTDLLKQEMPKILWD